MVCTVLLANEIKINNVEEIEVSGYLPLSVFFLGDLKFHRSESAPEILLVEDHVGSG